MAHVNRLRIMSASCAYPLLGLGVGLGVGVGVGVGVGWTGLGRTGPDWAGFACCAAVL
jgi:hypothetical protein